MKLYLGNCLARYLYYRDKDNKKKYKWCTNYRYIQNTKCTKLLENEDVVFNINRYVDLVTDYKYSTIFLPMSQFFVRDYYVRKKNIYTELNNYDKAQWECLSKKLSINYYQYYIETIIALRKINPDTKIITFLKTIPDSNLNNCNYGNFSYQFNEENLNRDKYTKLYLLDNVDIIDEAAIANRLVRRKNDLDVLFPWLSYNSKNKYFFRDLNHYSEYYIDALHLQSQKIKKKNVSWGVGTLELIKEKSQPIYRKLFTNKYDILANSILRAKSGEQINQLFEKPNLTMTEIFNDAITAYVRNDNIKGYYLTLNITGYQSLVTNLCYKIAEFNMQGSSMLKELKTLYLTFYNSVPFNSPVRTFFKSYLDMIYDIEKINKD